MWDQLGTWTQILKAAVIGIEFAISVGVGYYLMHRGTSRTIDHLKDLVRQKWNVTAD